MERLAEARGGATQGLRPFHDDHELSRGISVRTVVRVSQ
jgi:hypothetical protein